MDSLVPGQPRPPPIDAGARSSEFPPGQSLNPENGGHTKLQSKVHHLDSPMVSRLVIPMSSDENLEHIHCVQARSSLTSLLSPATGKRISSCSEVDEVNNDFNWFQIRSKRFNTQ
jgi:hypothetical protein